MSALTGKVAIVTGGSRGIGAAIATRLAGEGADVLITYRDNAEAANRVVDACRDAGVRSQGLRADISDIDATIAVVQRAVEEFGRLDVLVNNAAVAQFLPLPNITQEHFDSQFAVNVRGVVFATQAAIRVMTDGGCIVNISSGLAEVASPGTSVYSATKAALQAMTRSWAAELGARRIRVNCVAPGITETEMLRSAVTEELISGMIATTPLGRIGAPEDIAGVVAFLAGDDARWITGQTIGVNGGLR